VFSLESCVQSAAFSFAKSGTINSFYLTRMQIVIYPGVRSKVCWKYNI